MTSDLDDSFASEPTIAAVVVTYNRPEGVRRTVGGLLAQSRRPDCIVVVDNGGGAPALLAELPPSERTVVRVIDSSSNLGAAGGFELGFREAQRYGASWVYLLNDDDWPRPQAIATLLQEVTADPRLVGAATYVSVNGTARSVGARFVHGIRYPTEADKQQRRQFVDVLTFSGLLVSVRAVDAVGGIRSDFFMMWEEFELCLRLRRAGGELLVLTDPLLDLVGHGEGGSYPPWRGYYEARNGLVTLRSFHGHGAWPWWLRRQLKFVIASIGLPNPGRRIALRFVGYWHGLRNRMGRTVEPS